MAKGKITPIKSKKSGSVSKTNSAFGGPRGGGKKMAMPAKGKFKAGGF